MADEKKTPGNPGKTEENKSVKTEEGTIIHFDEKMWVEGTGNNKHMPKGDKYEVQKVHGERLIKMGAAVETKAPPKPKAPAKKEKESDD